MDILYLTKSINAIQQIYFSVVLEIKEANEKLIVTTIKPLVNYIIQNRTIINLTAISHASCLNIHTQ
jgi:hypothetical protein